VLRGEFGTTVYDVAAFLLLLKNPDIQHVEDYENVVPLLLFMQCLIVSHVHLHPYPFLLLHRIVRLVLKYRRVVWHAAIVLLMQRLKKIKVHVILKYFIHVICVCLRI
jgi:hypothetical protein